MLIDSESRQQECSAVEAVWRSRLAAMAGEVARERLFPPGTPLQPAAVLVPLIRRPEGYSVLFTKRAEQLAVHAGQVSFPGGRQDPTDADLWMTALRETHEEIGVPPEAVEPLAPLAPVISITRFHVTPFAGFLPADFPYRINPDEVATVFEVPLSHLQDPAVHRVEYRTAADGRDRYAVHHFAFDGHDIWGMTGHILYRFLKTIGGHEGPPIPGPVGPYDDR